MKSMTKYLEDLAPMPIHHAEAKAAWMAFRVAHGCSAYLPLLSKSNVKLAKDDSVAVFGLSLLPANLGPRNSCTHSTPQCRRFCLNETGRGGMAYVQDGRWRRSHFLHEHPRAFVTLLSAEIGRLFARHGRDLRIRLNVFSDLRWEVIVPWLFERHALVRFYDYTKVPLDQRPTPSNYLLTPSATERTTPEQLRSWVGDGHSPAIVVDVPKGEPIPATIYGVPAVDGDLSDNRWRDPRGVAVALRPKGRLARTESAFVHSVDG